MINFYEKQCDNAILISSDGDYAGLVKFLKEKGKEESIKNKSEKEIETSFNLIKLALPKSSDISSVNADFPNENTRILHMTSSKFGEGTVTFVLENGEWKKMVMNLGKNNFRIMNEIHKILC